MLEVKSVPNLLGTPVFPIWAHGAWRSENLRPFPPSLSVFSAPGSRKALDRGQSFEPIRSPDTIGATSRMKHSIDWRSWSRLRLPWKLI